ncbi:MAG: hypothetical protein ABSF21_00370 [Dehalococcoidia bacterium]|jgi:hypothetical protein
MNKMSSLFGPTLDNYGQCEVVLGDFDEPARDYFDRLITNTATGGGTAVPETNTQGYAIGQVITIQDSLNHEDFTIAAITPATQLTAAANLTNTYTVARGGKLTVKKYAAARVNAYMANPFTASLSFGLQVLLAKPLLINGTIALALTQGELVTGGTSAATGRVIAQTATSVTVFPIFGTFVAGETLTGFTSGRTVTGIVLFGNIQQTALITIEKVDINAGALRWQVATTANVAGMLLTVEADEL